MSTETIDSPDVSEADRDWWSAESNREDPGHDAETPTADVPGVEPPADADDGPGWDERAALAGWMERYESGWF